MPICYIFGAAPINDPSYIQIQPQEDDFLICADGGYQLAQRLNLQPDLLVGDFDSNQEQPNNIPTVRVNPVKDHTDLSLAVDQGEQAGYQEFQIYGALGGRFDHSIAMVQLLAGAKKKGLTLHLYDEANEVFAIYNETISIPASDYQYFSLFSLTEQSQGVSITGAAYPLQNACFTSDFPLGISNEVTSETAIVSVGDGMLLIVFSSDLHKQDPSCIR